jgi:putative phosphoribosyl transferase
MECFEDRSHAGRLLADLLAPYRDRSDVVVLGLPRGGVPVALEVATALKAPLDVMVVQKIGAPGVREFIIGAIAPGGVVALNDDALSLCLDTPDFRSEAIREGMELKRREALYRGNSVPLILSRRTVILVDDGAATGASMRAAVRSARMFGASRIIVALGVSPKELLPIFRVEADEAICAKAASSFCSIAQHYRQFSCVADEEITPRLHPSRLPDYHKVPS